MTAGNRKQTAKPKAKPRGKPFAPGQSGNISGRPKIPVEVRDAARAHTELAIATLAEICTSADKDSARVSAAVALLDRGWGKPLQEVAGPGGGAIPVEVKQLGDDELVARAAAIINQRKNAK